MLKILLRPLCFSSIMFTRDNGPVGAINGRVIKVIYLCIEANSLRKASNLRNWKFKMTGGKILYSEI